MLVLPLATMIFRRKFELEIENVYLQNLFTLQNKKLPAVNKFNKHLKVFSRKCKSLHEYFKLILFTAPLSRFPMKSTSPMYEHSILILHNNASEKKSLGKPSNFQLNQHRKQKVNFYLPRSVAARGRHNAVFTQLVTLRGRQMSFLQLSCENFSPSLAPSWRSCT